LFGAARQVAALADRAATSAALDDSHAVARLLDSLREAGAASQIITLRAPLPSAGVFYLFLKSANPQFRFGREPDGADLKHGKVKQARRLLSTALLDPTDNALAQAEWSAKRGLDIVNTDLFDMPRSYEARARYYYRNEQFDEALRCGELWLADQPFALDPAMFTSFVAAMFVDDQAAAIRGPSKLTGKMSPFDYFR
jgi:hypothetical protein